MERNGVVQVGFYLSADATIDAGDTLLATRSLASLLAGDSDLGSTSITIPAGTPAGTYTLGAIADYLLVVTETDETNNAFAVTGTITVTADIDLRPSVVTGPVTAAAGEVVSLANTVDNDGLSDAPGFQVGVYLSTDATIERTTQPR